MGFSANEVSGGADASYNGRTDAIPPGKKESAGIILRYDGGRGGGKKGGMKVLRLHHKRWL